MFAQFKITLTTLTTISAGGATVLTEGTLVPISIFTTGVVVLTTAAWRISAAIQRQADALATLNDRINRIEARYEQRYLNHSKCKR